MITFLLQVSGSMLLFYGFYTLLLKHETFFHLNRFYLVDSALASLALPLIAFKFPWQGGSSLALGTVFLDEVTIGGMAALSTWQSIDWHAWLLLIYVGGATFMALRLATRMANLLSFTKKLTGVKRQGYRLLYTDGKLPTFTFLNFIFWDNSLKISQKEAEKILQHELAHLRGKHSYDMLLMESLKIFLWFNPVVYWYQQALSEQHEYAADAAVLKTTDKYDYGQLMVKTLFTQLNLAFAHGFNHSPIKKRIIMMNRSKTPSVKSAKFLLAIPLAALMLVFYSCENSEDPLTAEKKVLIEKSDATFGDKVFQETEVSAEPQDGLPAFFQYLAENITYPQSAKEEGIEGKVYVEFIINKDGGVASDEVKVLRGISPECDAAALDVIKNMPSWKNAEQDGLPVRQKMVVPIKFSLN